MSNYSDSSNPRGYNVVGHSVEKVDALALACGQPLFVADVPQQGVLVAKVLRSRHAHARIKRIDTAAAKAVPGVHAVLTHEDLPRIPHTTAGQGFPEPSGRRHIRLWNDPPGGHRLVSLFSGNHRHAGR